METFRDRVLRNYFDKQDIRYDKSSGINFGRSESASVSKSGQQSRILGLGDHSTGHQACWVRNIRKVIEISKKLDPDIKNFIDLGSGRGKALYVAATENNFAKVIGVEFDDELVSISKNSFKDYPSLSEIDIIPLNAAEYLLPGEKSLVFLFNPFDDSILKSLLTLNELIILESKHIFAYVNDVHRDIFREFGMHELYREDKRKISIWK